MGYYDIIRRRVSLGGMSLPICWKPGLAAWEEAEAPSALLAEAAPVDSGMRVLVLEAGTGALAAWAARRGAEVHSADGSLIAARMTGETLAAAGVSAAIYEAAAPPPDAGLFDLALLPLPKGRAYASALIAEAWRRLPPGGQLYLAGANDAGAKAVVKDAAAIFGSAVTLRTKARCRLALAVRGHEAGSSDPGGIVLVPFQAAGLALYSAPGVFSYGALDDGTARLLDTLTADLCAGRRVLDVGCGGGPIGLTAVRLGAAAVDLVDIFWPALDCARAGISASGATSCRAWASDLYTDVTGPSYDLILSNPPFHAGHQVETEAAEALINGSRERLAAGGRLRLVANRFLPYDRLLRAQFGAGRVRVVREDTRYRVLEAAR